MKTDKRKLTPFGKVVKKRLIDKGMTQAELALKIGTSRMYLNLILHGDRSGEKYRDEIMKVLGINSEDFKLSA